MIAYAKLFIELGYDVFLFLSKDYSKMIEGQEIPVYFLEKGIHYPEADLILFQNVSTVNYKVAAYYKKLGTKVFYVYHEPFHSVSEYLKEGIKQTIKAIVAHHFSVKLLKLSDLVIVPSNFALKLYQKNDMKHCKNVVVIPLLFDDELKGPLKTNKKEYFSYIGHAVIGHSFDVYLDSIKYAYRNGSELKFMIATRTNLNRLLRRDKILQEMISNGILQIIHGRPLKNSEINEAYLKSFCVWNVYRRNTQSGVLPKAFMFGTPVLASNVGSFGEFIREGENGLIIDKTAMKDFDLILASVEDIKRNLVFYSKNARETFLKIFFYKNCIENFRTILNSLF
jgi:glycosyltransferase involved in cell wall biosynthesis